MQLGTALIAAFMILLIFGVTDMPTDRLQWRKGWICLLLTAVLAGNAYPVRVIAELSFNPGAVLLLAGAGVFAARGKNGFFPGLLLSVPAGAAVYLLQRVSAGAEPGLIYGLAAGGISAAMIARPRGAMFAAATAPLTAQMMIAAEELLDFGYTRIDAGSGKFFDTMIVGMAFVFFIYSLSMIKIRRPRPAEPENADVP